MTTARTSGVITIAGTPHPYLSEGKGLPCIVAGLAPFYPPLFSDRLKQRIRFIFVDFKNTWGAEALRDADKITMDTLVEEIDDVRRALGLEKVCVVGHSAPGFLPLEFALRHPDRMSHGIVIGTPPFFNHDFDKVQSPLFLRPALRRLRGRRKSDDPSIDVPSVRAEPTLPHA